MLAWCGKACSSAVPAQPSRSHAIPWSHVQVMALCGPSCRRRTLGRHKCLRSQSQHAGPGSIWTPYSRVAPVLPSQMSLMQVRAMAELQQAPALTPTQLEKLPVLADGAGAEPDETMLSDAEVPVKLNLRKHIKTAMNKGNTCSRSCRSRAKRIARDLRGVPLEACTTCLPHQCVRQRLTHARCLSRVQRAEVERRKRVKARHERGFWPSV